MAGLLTLALPWFVAALVAVLVARARATSAVGETIASDRPQLALRRWVLIVPQTAALLLALTLGGELSVATAELLALGALVAWLSPGFHDAVCGSTGVQRGWHARRFEDLEEWRLAGDHLRFRLFGEWTSVPLPVEDQVRVREVLARVNPKRESVFQD